MKNFCAVILAALCLFNSGVFAAEFPQFLNGDKNYPCVWNDSQAALKVMNFFSTKMKLICAFSIKLLLIGDI